MQHGGGDGDGEGKGGMIDVTYQVTDTVEPSHQTVPLLGEVIFGDQTSLFARCWGLSTGAAETPRAKKRRAAGNLIGNIIFIVRRRWLKTGTGSSEERNAEERERERERERVEMEDEVRYTNEERVGGSSSPLNTRKKRRAAVRRAANRMNPRKAPLRVQCIMMYWCVPAPANTRARNGDPTRAEDCAKGLVTVPAPAPPSRVHPGQD